MTLLGTFFALGLLMLKLKRSCEKPPSFEEAVKLALARETLSRDMHGLAECLQMACIHSISDARVIPFLRHTGHRRHTHVGASIPASRGVGKTEAGSLPQQSSATTGTRQCYRCGREDHDPRNCRFKSYECRVCRKKGHLQAMCRSRGATRYLETEEEKWEREERDEQEEEGDTYAQKLEALGIFHNQNKGQRGIAPWTATVEVDNVNLEMEIDTGSAKSIIGKDTFYRFFSDKQLNKKAPVLTTYPGTELPMKGTLEVTVKHDQQTHQLELLVADVTGQLPILGREWLSRVKIDRTRVLHVSKTKQLDGVLAKHEPVFLKMDWEQ